MTHNAKTGSKYAVLLEDRDVIRWYRHLAKGAVATGCFTSDVAFVMGTALGAFAAILKDFLLPVSTRCRCEDSE